MGNSDMKVFFGIFIGVILAVALLVPAADTVFNSRNTFNQTNVSVTAPAVNATLTLTGRSLVSATTPVVRNATNFALQNTGIFVTDGLINGAQTVFLSTNDTGSNNAGNAVNVSYLFVPDGFVPGAAGTILGLVVLFGALGVLIFVVFKVVKEGSMANFVSNFGRR